MTKDEALKMAILQMKSYGFKHLCDYQCDDKELLEVIKVCEKALAQPAQKQWVGLSDDDFKDTSWFTEEFIEGANWAQNKLKELNHGS